MSQLSDIPSILFLTAAGQETTELSPRCKFTMYNVMHGGDGKVVMRVQNDAIGHPTIASFIEREKRKLPSKARVSSWGGGDMRVNLAAKKIVIGGSSVTHGAPDYPLAIEFLRTVLPDFDIQKDPGQERECWNDNNPSEGE